jgi:signal peptidase I
VPLLPFLDALAQEEQATGGLRGFIDTAARTPLSQVVIGVAVLTVLRMAMAPYLRNTAPHKRLGTYSIARFFNEVLDAIIYAGVFVFMIIRPFGIQAFLIPSGSMWPTLHVNDFIVANKAIYRYSDPKLNDIVVFRPPIQAVTPDQKDSEGQVKVDFIKRCVGTPGDVVELRDGVLYRNGKAVPDPYRHYSTTMDYVTFQEMPTDQVAQTPQASFKWIKWKGRIIPLNYTRSEANAATRALDNSYAVAPDFVIPDQADQLKAIAAPAQPLPPGDYMMMGDNRNNSFDSRGWGMVPRDSIIGRSEFIWLPLDRIGTTR